MAVGAIFGFDPLEYVTNIVVVILVAILLALAWKYRGRVCKELTGDDRIHCTFIDVVWVGFFHCCGTCTGDWTRPLTRACCCLSKSWRGVNLIRVIGQTLGFTTVTVEIKNIVVGDLPWDSRDDFYLAVECQQNPPMVTSVAEEKHPKCVHFPEVLTVKLCRSLLEQNLTIRVYKMGVVGHTELCSCHINAMQVLDWSEDPNDQTKRFEMKLADNTLERETPPWCLLVFDQPSEVRDLENFHGNINTVRTAPVDGEPYRDVNVATFKHQYTLLDPSGHAIQEPLEEDLEEIQCLTRVVGQLYSLIMFVLFWGLIGYLLFRSYTWSCYRQYNWVTMAAMHNMTFPVSTANMQSLVKQCDTLYEGTGAETGIPCRPNLEQVMGMCNSTADGGHFPPQQPRPTAFKVLVKTYLGLEIEGAQCYYGVCSMRNVLVHYDRFIIPACVGLWLFGCGLRMALNRFIRHRKTMRQREAALATQQMQRGRLNARGGRSAFTRGGQDSRQVAYTGTNGP